MTEVKEEGTLGRLVSKALFWDMQDGKKPR